MELATLNFIFKIFFNLNDKLIIHCKFIKNLSLKII